MEKEAEEILEQLESNGFYAYKVGGCVRDLLLGSAVNDIDLATSATPEQVMALFPHVIPTGIKHGTVTVIWKGLSFECTTFRLDTSYSNHRQPDRVEFVTDITQDLKRRDFTINAMAMDRRGNLVDPYGGKEDLQQRTLRAVGNPYERFTEDALRILRGIRFSSRFSLQIEQATRSAMTSLGDLLRAVSTERVRDELHKMISGNHPEQALNLLSTPGLLPFEDLSQLFASQKIEGLPHGLETLPAASRWAGLLLHVGWEQSQAESFLRHWRFSNHAIQNIIKLFTIAQSTTHTELQGKRQILEYGLAQMLEGLKIRSWLTGNGALVDIEQWEAWDSEILIHTPKQLAIQAQDLISTFGRKPGPWIGQVLHILFLQVALHGISNEQEILMAEARKVLNTSEGTDIKPI